MKGVILAGGLGSRLSPLTDVTNKHLLPVWDKPMIYYPIRTLLESGIQDIMIVTGGSWAGDFIKLLGTKKFMSLVCEGLPIQSVNFHYTYQDGDGGIPDALRYAKHFVDGDNVCVILGDNIFQTGCCTEFIQSYQKEGGKILLKEMDNPERFGVAALSGNKIIHLVEKPLDNISPYAITGIFCFDSQVWGIIDTLSPSRRGELEVVDIHNQYLSKNQLEYSICYGWWSDAGTFESLYQSSRFIRGINKNI